jgi:FMN-dependent NADH-azoreductase
MASAPNAEQIYLDHPDPMEPSMNILQINSSARREASHSTRLATRIVARLRDADPDATLTVRDLNLAPHPMLDEQALGALFTPASQRTPEQAARVALDDALIAEIQAADVVVLGVPMYNFGVPAPLKNWIDAISRAGVTFRYTEKGPEGLLKGKKVYVALTRGGNYRNTPADTQVPYLTTLFTFLGLVDVHFVYAEGLSLGSAAEQTAIASAYEQIEEAVAA